MGHFDHVEAEESSGRETKKCLALSTTGERRFQICEVDFVHHHDELGTFHKERGKNFPMKKRKAFSQKHKRPFRKEET